MPQEGQAEVGIVAHPVQAGSSDCGDLSDRVRAEIGQLSGTDAAPDLFGRVEVRGVATQSSRRRLRCEGRPSQITSTGRQFTPTGGVPVSLGITTLHGHPMAVAARQEEVTAALAPVASVAFPPPDADADAAARRSTLATASAATASSIVVRYVKMLWLTLAASTSAIPPTNLKCSGAAHRATRRVRFTYE